MEHVYLSRKNLTALLSKLDRKKTGDDTFCSIVKSDNKHPEFPQTMDACMVTAVEDEEYYKDREAGPVHPKDEAKKVETKEQHESEK